MSRDRGLRSSVRTELSLGAFRRGNAALRLGAIAALWVGLASAPAAAQPPYRQELIAGFSSLDANQWSSPDLADLDADGDLDMVVGEEEGRPRYFENIGSSSTPCFVEMTGVSNPFGVVAGRGTSPDLVDLDADGDFDAVIGDLYGSVSYFENTGSSTAPVFVARTGAGNPFFDVDVGMFANPDLVDLDGDGDLDAIIGGSPAGLSYFKNTGSAIAPSFAEVTGSSNPFDGAVVGLSSPDLADLDGDGDLDAVVGERYGNLKYFANTGSSLLPAFVELFGTSNPFDGIDVGGVFGYSSPDLVDLDADGDLDAVVGEYYGSSRFFTNTGSSAAPAFAEVTAGVDIGQNSAPELADLDADGDLDAVVGERYGGLPFFLNTGASTAPAFALLSGAANPFDGFDVGDLGSPDLVDLDGDGDLDAIVGESNGRLRYFANTGSSMAPAFVERSGAANPFFGIDVGSRSGPELVDLDGDGDLDAVVGGDNTGTSSLRYLANTGSSTAPAFVEVSGTANPFDGLALGIYLSPKLVDLDRDGDLDAVVGEFNGRLLYLGNVGSSTAPVFTLVSGAANPFAGIDVDLASSPDLADLDGDGDLDAIVGERGGGLVFYRSLRNVFADGFESGDTSAWSGAVPP